MFFLEAFFERSTSDFSMNFNRMLLKTRNLHYEFLTTFSLI